jgi:GNAT superfamily N-acetyltransferase
VRELFREYEQALGVDLCFQGFADELASLPAEYAPPRGRLYLAHVDHAIAGCAGLRPASETAAELKRLYVRAAFRGQHLGRKLAERAIADARAIGFRAVVLDTLPSMKEAHTLYASLGFRECAPYTASAVPGTQFLEKVLTTSLG